MKNMPNMDAPKTKKEGAKTGVLMDNQEQTTRGEQALYNNYKEVKEPTTVLLPYDLKHRAKALAAKEGTTLTFMISLGLKKQVEQDSIWI